ncbi:hypothetical protein MRX96_015649 [Rhipicephalus microplus]
MAVYTVEDIQKLAEDKIRFRPQIFVDVEKVNTSATLLGQAVSLPVGLAPSAAQKIMNPEGEIGSAKGKANHSVS